MVNKAKFVWENILNGKYLYPSILWFNISAKYYKLSICRGYMCHDNAHSTKITIIKTRLDLHSRKTVHTSPLRASYRVYFVSYTMKNDRYISRAHCNTFNRIEFVAQWGLSIWRTLLKLLPWFSILKSDHCYLIDKIQRLGTQMIGRWNMPIYTSISCW